MVDAHPDLLRRIRNTDNIVIANRPQLVPTLYTKYPQDYIDLDALKKLRKIQPWIEGPKIKKIKFSTSSQIPSPPIPPIPDRILVICVDFPDLPAQKSITDIHNRFFSNTGNSLRNYYKEVSYNQYIPEGLVYGWYRMPRSITYYTNDGIGGCYGFGIYPHNLRKLFEDIINIIKNDPNIDWSYIDNNNDNIIDYIAIVHSGPEAAATGNCNNIWASAWGLQYNIGTTGKTTIGSTGWNVLFTSEYISRSSEIPRIGVDVHEFGHLLDLPDLYDYDCGSGSGFCSSGVGYYSLMSAGSWTNNGITPTHLDAWSKYKLGFTTATINPQGPVSIIKAETDNNIIKYTTTDYNEYFLIENRQKISYDTYLPAHGLYMWHINENQIYNTNESCYLVGLIQADGYKDLENARNNGDSSDSFPGLLNKRSFSPITTPSPILCNGSVQNISIIDISDSADIMTFNSILSIGSLKFITNPTASEIYFDTTLQGITDPSTGILIIDNIPAGTIINYTVKKTGYQNRSGSIVAIEGVTTDISVILSVIPLYGTLDISSTPSEAKIYIDGEDTNETTPATISNLTPGNHTYKLTLTGYHNKTGQFNIMEGQTTVIDITLQPIVVRAGLNTIQMLIIGGLLIGMIYQSTIEPITIKPITIKPISTLTSEQKIPE